MKDNTIMNQFRLKTLELRCIDNFFLSLLCISIIGYFYYINVDEIEGIALRMKKHVGENRSRRSDHVQ